MLVWSVSMQTVVGSYRDNCQCLIMGDVQSLLVQRLVSGVYGAFLFSVSPLRDML